jgi:hypothetical protein
MTKMTKMTKTNLPQGWSSEDAYDERFLLIRSAPPKSYMATIDWQERCVRLGFVTRGPAISDKEYAGRGWRDDIVEDAVAHLRSIP